VKVTNGPNLTLIDGAKKREASKRASDPAAATPPPRTDAARPPGIVRILSAVKEAPETSAKVEGIRQALAEGSYKLSSMDIADAMLRESAKFHGLTE